MDNISKIKISGTSYSIKDENACKVVELTQAQYDALPASAKTSNSLFVITDAEGADLSNYYTKSETSGATEISTALANKADTATTYTKTEVDNAITAATSTKQDTLVSGTNIKTINNESILGSGNIDIQGGDGKAVSGGTNISITTGETADTINCTLPFSYEGDNLKTTVSGNSFVNYFHYGQIFGINNTLQGRNSAIGKEKNTTIIGYSNQSLRMDDSIVIGSSNNLGNIFGINYNNYVFGFSNTVNPVNTQDNLVNNNFVIGNNNTINQKSNNFIFGYGIKPSNNDEFSLGKYNNSVSGSSTFGDSGNTLFSVGNGTADNARHNAFEIRQNGDIYITKNGQDVKLQDQLGGGGGSSYTAGDGIDITNDVISVTGKVDTSAITSSVTSASTDSELPTAKAVYDAIATGGGSITIDPSLDSGSTNPVANSAITTALNAVSGAIPTTYVNSIGADSDAGYQRFYRFSTPSNFNYFLLNNAKINNKAILSTNWGGFDTNFSLVETSAITTSITSSSTDVQVPSAKAVNDKLGGLSLVKLTQSEYDALSTKDSNTLYVIVN